MGEALFKKLPTLLFVIFSSTSMADNLQDQIDNIVLTDETKNSLMKQDKIIGCDDSLKINELKCSKDRTPEDRDKDIDEIKSQLSSILEQLAQLKQEKDSYIKESKFTTIQQNITKLRIPQKTQSYSKHKEIKVLETHENFVIVEVQSGESLSKYAQKYYGDSRKYYKIYKANQDKISKNLQIFIGDKLIVPTSDLYEYNIFEKEQDFNNPISL
ncbi:MAG: LysM peptidoglycan-binding domain-containing protein [Sulfurovaceae bacterium]|nr:LysM peptidoglycan-binding domain-containing protein [Sulfurovaceae bacterium]